MTKDIIKHSYENAPTQLELSNILATASGKDRVILILAGKYGMRAGEIEHMRASWLNVDNENSKTEHTDHIRIPRFGDPCSCDVCMLQEWFKFQKNKEKKHKHDKTKIKKTFIWYKDTEKEYYRLKKHGKLPELPKHDWSPKSSAGARLIPLSFPEHTSYLQDYFSKNDSLGIGRQAIWLRMKKYKIHTHSFRATALKYWGDRNINPRSLMKLAGHATIASSDPYINRDVHEMVEETKQIVKKEK
jgi:integrase